MEVDFRSQRTAVVGVLCCLCGCDVVVEDWIAAEGVAHVEQYCSLVGGNEKGVAART